MKPKSVAPQSMAMAVDRKLHNTWVYIKRHWQLYLLFLMPAVLLTLVFRYIPMGGVLIAFQKYNPFKGIWGSEWVGFKNFTRFLSSPDFMRYLINTLKLSVYGLLWGFPIPILLAFLLNRIKSNKIKQKVQLVLYMPNFISVIVLCGIVRVLLSVTGPVNGLFHTGINFMTLPEAFRPIYIISGIHKAVPPIRGLEVQKVIASDKVTFISQIFRVHFIELSLTVADYHTLPALNRLHDKRHYKTAGLSCTRSAVHHNVF